MTFPELYAGWLASKGGLTPFHDAPESRRAFLSTGASCIGAVVGFTLPTGTTFNRIPSHQILGASVSERSTTTQFDVPGIVTAASQDPAQLIVGPPVPEALARGLLVVPYRALNLRILPVYGPEALRVSPKIGHLHVTVDDSPWHWVDASGEPLVIQHLSPGPHRVLLELADPTHHVIDHATVEFDIPIKMKTGNVSPHP